MVFRHTAGNSHRSMKMGDGSFETKSPIYDYSTGNGGMEPVHTNNFPAGKCTRMHKSPAGETPKMWSDKTPPSYSPSGSNYSGPMSGSGAGKTAYPQKSADKRTYPLNIGLKRQMNRRSDFDQRAGTVGTSMDHAAGRRPSKKGMEYI
jgi:hypothetical protein